VDGTPPGLIGYEEHPAGSKGLHMNFAFVADVATRELSACDEWTEARWLSETGGIECPENVRQLLRVALAAPGSPAG
jgi:8-oxo-dGTP diphosphatase